MPSLKRFYAELRRRKVLRVAGVYLISAWAAIEVADTVFPNLGLPPWTVTLVIMLAALAFPLTIVLAWVFDLTRDGVQRTTETSHGDVERERSGAGPRPLSPLRAGASWAALLLIALVALGAWWMRGRNEDHLDSRLVAVMPFRVAGADASLGYLREGLMDLLAATLTGRDGVPAAVSPRTLTQVLREHLGSLDADPAEEEALAIARTLGAGRVLEGELVGSAENLAVSARLYDTSTGREVTRTSFRLPADSLHGIVDRIAARLMAAEAGLGEDRLASVTTTSLPALRAYLEGAQAFRRGHHFRALHAWDRALDLDSTFVLAALGLSRAQGWTIIPSSHSERAFDIAWRGRSHLGEADRALLEASSPHFPLLETYRDLIEARQQAVERFPHDPDLRFLLGDGYLHYGPAAGFPESTEAARAQLTRVVAADSTHIETLMHLYDLAVVTDDTASLRHYGDLLLAVDSTGPQAVQVLYHRSPESIDLDTLPAPALARVMYDGILGRPDTAAIDAAWRALSRPHEPTHRRLLTGRSGLVAVLEGRPARLWELMDRGNVFGEHAAERLRVAVFWNADPARAADEAAEVRRRLAELQSGAGALVDAVELVTHQCILAHWEAWRGSATGAARLASELADWHGSHNAPPVAAPGQLARNTAGLCADLVSTTLAVEARAADAAARLRSVDARLDAGIRVVPSYYETANLHAGRLWRALGRPDQALRAVRRRVVLPGHTLLHAESLGEEARILDDLGRREEAIEVYARLLGWRERAEGAFAEQAARDRARLAALLEQRG